MNLGWTFLTKDLLLLVSNFNCEYPYISEYLRNPNYAYNDLLMGETKTFVFMDKDHNNALVGYSSIKCSSLRVESGKRIIWNHFFPKMYRNIDVYPCIEIVMLARDLKYRGCGTGEPILYFMLNYINQELRPRVGIRAITLFSVPQKVDFYKNKFEFRKLDKGMDMYVHPSCEGCIPMFLALPRLKD